MGQISRRIGRAQMVSRVVGVRHLRIVGNPGPRLNRRGLCQYRLLQVTGGKILASLLAESAAGLVRLHVIGRDGEDAEYRSGEHLFVHGDAALEEASRWASSTTGRIFMGHEHPAACIGDGVASWSKCPCFLVSKKVVVLPAFSSWAAGTIFPRYPFMSPLAQKAGFRQSIAIMGNKLLPLPFGAEAVS